MEIFYTICLFQELMLKQLEWMCFLFVSHIFDTNTGGYWYGRGIIKIFWKIATLNIQIALHLKSCEMRDASWLLILPSIIIFRYLNIYNRYASQIKYCQSNVYFQLLKMFKKIRMFRRSCTYSFFDKMTIGNEHCVCKIDIKFRNSFVVYSLERKETLTVLLKRLLIRWWNR